ncbi:zinc ribbon domain-containing protein [Pallidibacillus pasinlerensis]|uniref:Zinc-ribbon domain-containing protein n=1 Tax=Pallidibacillus pasinlerensis TaxID=2703818 RepID=A0ABX0A5S5_9BACI|nr:zinc ribbon domain-containing protein [Pallidibacillus pasinlerensis]NCU18152.1 zinc-ribbon domain-containing protein [Pallidibacillus pasinlerensis]
MKFCNECGKPLAEGALFCSECGARIEPQQDQSAQEGGQPSDTSHGEQQSDLQSQDESAKETSSQSQQSNSDGNESNQINKPSSQSDAKQLEGEASQSSYFQSSHEQNQGPNQFFGQSQIPEQEPTPGQSQMQVGPNTPSGPVPPAPPKTPRKKLSKGALISIISGAALIVLLVVTHFVLNYMFSADRLIANFEKAIEKKDVDTLVDMLSANHKSVEIDENAVEAYLGYFEENEDELETVIKSLKRQADGRWDFVHMAMLEKDGKFLYFDKYKIVVPTGHINVYTNMEGVKILVDGEEVGVSDSDFYEETFGPFITGKHKVEAVLETEYLQLTTDEEVVIYDDGQYFVDLYMEADTVYFSLPYMYGTDVEVKLLINGTDVGVDLTEQDEFGPVLIDGSMTYAVEAEFPWGTVQTEEQPIDDYFVEVDLIDKSTKQAIMNTVHNYQLEWIEAMTSDNVDAMTHADELLKDFAQMNIDSYKSMDIAFSFQYLSTIVDLNSFYFYYDEYDRAWKVDVIARSNYLYNEYFIGEEPPSLIEYIQDFEYYLSYDEEQEKWIVEYIYETWYFNDDNTEEIVVESPETFTSSWTNGDAGDGGEDESSE